MNMCCQRHTSGEKTSDPCVRVKLCACICPAQDSSLWSKLFPRACWPLLWLLHSHFSCPLPGTFDSFLPSISAAPSGREPSRCLSFSLFHCSCHPQWPACLLGLLQRWDVLQVCRHPGGLQTFSSLNWRGLGSHLRVMLVSGVFGAWASQWFFFWLAIPYLEGGLPGDSCSKGVILGSRTCQLRVGSMSQVIYSLLLPKRNVYWQFKRDSEF